jgi:hypothetical protein
MTAVAWHAHQCCDPSFRLQWAIGRITERSAVSVGAPRVGLVAADLLRNAAVGYAVESALLENACIFVHSVLSCTTRKQTPQRAAAP